MILELADIHKRRGADYALRIESLNVQAGEHVAILGPSGCGKSTTLDVIGMALDIDSAKTFRFSPGNQSHDIAAIWQRNDQSALAALRRKNMGYVLQTGEIFAFLNVASNIELTALAAGMAENEAKERVGRLLDKLEIANLASAMPHTLSIGQRQRVAIARALAPDPALILADEPTSALDPVLSRKVMKLLLEAVADFGSALILVSHDHQLVSEFGFRKTEIIMQGNEAVLNEQK